MKDVRLPVYIVLTLALLLVVACSRDGGGDSDTTRVAADDPATQDAGASTEATPAETALPGPSATATVTPAPTSTPTPTRVPTGPVTVCTAEEPPSLYLYGPRTYSARVVHDVIYDGPIDTQAYGYQAVILEKIPALADGDARIETVTVEEGDSVVDANGNVVRLRDGIQLRPSGCFGDDCAVTFTVSGAETSASSQPDEEGAVAVDSLEMDQLVVDFTLLPDLSWADGERLTVEDSVFSYELAQSAQIPPRQRTGTQGLVPERRVDPVERTASYTAVDELTVRWTGLPGHLDPYYQGNFFHPLPSHQLEGLEAEALQSAEESARLPLGWGPYTVAEWVDGERIVAERNPHYFRAGEGLPYYDRVIVRFIGDGSLAPADAVANGDCDLVTNDALPADWQRFVDLEADGALTFHRDTGTIWEHLDFGINTAPHYDWRGDLFQDRRVRQAAAHCVNRQRIMEEVTAGQSVVPDAYVPPDHPFYEQAELTHYEYDPQAGIGLLQEAGWRDTNGDGVSEGYGIEGLEEGTRLIFNYATTTSELQQRVAQMVAADLAQCGFQVTVNAEPVAPQVFFASDVNSPIFGRSFDVTSFAWFSDALPPCHLYVTSEIPDAGNGWTGFNVTGYSNEGYDTACSRANGLVPGMDGYTSSHLEALRIFNRDLPAIPLFVHLRAALTRPDLQGITLDPSQPTEMWNVENFRPAE